MSGYISVDSVCLYFTIFFNKCPQQINVLKCNRWLNSIFNCETYFDWFCKMNYCTFWNGINLTQIVLPPCIQIGFSSVGTADVNKDRVGLKSIIGLFDAT